MTDARKLEASTRAYTSGVIAVSGKVMKISSHAGVHHMAGNFKGKKHTEKASSTSAASDNPQSNTSNTINTITSGAQLSFQNKLAASAINQSTASDTGGSSSNASQGSSPASAKFDFDMN